MEVADIFPPCTELVRADEQTRRNAADQAGYRGGDGKGQQRVVLHKKICAGLSLRSVFASLAAFLVSTGLRSWVSFAVLRAWEGRQYQSTKATGSTAYNFGSISADEIEALFATLCCVLPYLVDRELRDLNTAGRQQDPQQAVVGDPMPGMVVACGRLLTWYSNVQRPSMTYAMIMETERREWLSCSACRTHFPFATHLSSNGWPMCSRESQWTSQVKAPRK